MSDDVELLRAKLSKTKQSLFELRRVKQSLQVIWEERKASLQNSPKPPKFDHGAMAQMTATEIRNLGLNPVRVVGDGNCLYRACLLAIFKNDTMHRILRLLVAIELMENSAYYEDHPYFQNMLSNFPAWFPTMDSLFVESASFDAYGHDDENRSVNDIISMEGMLSLKDQCYGSFLCVLACANVLERKIRLCHPSPLTTKEGSFFNAEISPRNDSGKDGIVLFWCKFGGISTLVTGSLPEKLNHFVPLMDIEQDQLMTNVWKKSLLIPVRSKVPKITKYFATASNKKQEPSARDLPETTLIASSSKIPVVKKSSPVTINTVCAETEVDQYDIGLHLTSLKELRDVQKIITYSSIWKPEKNFRFPVNDQKRSFQFLWLEQYPWLRYSKLYDGAFCIDCVSYLVTHGHNISKGDGMIKKPFKNWKNAVRTFKDHESKSPYHTMASPSIADLKRVVERKDVSVAEQLDTEAQKIINKNRKVLHCLVRIVVTLARQNIPLRGHRDDDTSRSEGSNMGNFKTIVDLCVELGCKELKEHFENAAKNATYTSKTIQNQLLKLCGDDILRQLVDDIKLNKFFSILADEATDISNQEQMPLVIRYVNSVQVVKEVMIEMVKCEGLDGKSLSDTILNHVKSSGLDMKNCRGQGYDGAGAMSGSCNGAAALIRNSFPKAIYIHCSSHVLNLCVASSCKIQLVENMMDHVRVVSDFFNNSTIRAPVLAEMIQTTYKKRASKEKLINVCKTRWVRRIDGLDLFVSYYKAIISALEAMKENRRFNTDTRRDATNLFYVCTSFEFIVVLVTVQRLLSHTRPLTVKLQKKDNALFEAYREVGKLLNVLLNVRETFDAHFNEIYDKIKELAEHAGCEPKRPRVCGRQQHRQNHNIQDVEEYYKVSVGIMFLDHLTEQIKTRFQPGVKEIFCGFRIIPTYVVQKDSWREDFLKFTEQYADDLPNPETLTAELFRWELRATQSHEELGDDILSTLRKTDKDVFPNIYQCLRIMATIPVTTCECERKISGLRRLKTWLRNSMSQSRLNSLAVIMENRDIEVNIDNVINNFASMHKRRMLLRNVFDELEDDTENSSDID